MAFAWFASIPAYSAIISEPFTSPTTQSNAGAEASLGTGGVGFSYDDNFGTWIYNSGNMGINEAAEGDGLGGSNGNSISSVGMARIQDERGTNARATSVIYSGSLFTAGVEYTVSFDVIGDPSGNDAGRYWLAAVSGYDNSGSNYIRVDGTWNGWNTAKPFAAFGSASVSYLADSIDNGVLLSGENVVGTTPVSFNFTYTTGDIAFSAGTYNNVYGISDFSIIPEPSSLGLLLIGAMIFMPLYFRRKR